MKSLEFKAYCDSNWASCILNRRSVIGFCIKLEKLLFVSKSIIQKTVSRSSAEGEYNDMAGTMSELTWIRGILRELEIHPIN